MAGRYSHFTFQYVSINTVTSVVLLSWKRSLHSNMFLLIRLSPWLYLKFVQTLHSNMFLLILYPDKWLMSCLVSLHSNMFLLIQEDQYCFKRKCCFTFQYVSINTKVGCFVVFVQVALHSNMFLLIRTECFRYGCNCRNFTFQYVSINTMTVDVCSP